VSSNLPPSWNRPAPERVIVLVEREHNLGVTAFLWPDETDRVRCNSSAAPSRLSLCDGSHILYHVEWGELAGVKFFRRRRTTWINRSKSKDVRRRIPRDQVQAGCRFSLVDHQGCDKQRVRFPLLSRLRPSSRSFHGCSGRLLSTEFMRLPSKCHYADYSSKSKIRSLSTRSSLGRKPKCMPASTQSNRTSSSASRTRRSTI